MLQLFEQKGRSIDECFSPFIANKVPQVGPGVEKVTIRNLLTMKSGMDQDDALSGNLWAFLNQYLLNQDLTKKPDNIPG